MTSNVPLWGKIGIGVGAGLIALVPVNAVTHPLRKTAADEIALSYGGGPFEGAQFQGITNPGSGIKFNGWRDHWYTYPTTQRDYIVSKDAEEGDKAAEDFIPATDADGVTQQVELTVTFKLNTNMVREFHEQVGMKFGAWNEGGWDKMLKETFRQPLFNSVNKSMKHFSTEDIAKDPDTIQKLQDEIRANLKNDITKLLGDEYFCGPAFRLDEEGCPDFELVIKAVTPPVSITDSYTAQKTSENGIITATNNGLAKKETAEAEKAASDAVAQALTPEYLAYLDAKSRQACAERDNCTMIVDATGDTTAVVPVGPSLGGR